ncbi:hypothetical protein VCHA53O466_40460 [Vibrio chagasii]|nr:hypothetical protein VCHA53O466_40460 [Vibrio chagasii]
MYRTKLLTNVNPLTLPTINDTRDSISKEVCNLVNDLSGKSLTNVPCTLGQLDHLSVRTSEGLVKFLDINISQKRKNKLRDLTCYFELGLNEGLQQLVHCWKQANESAIAALKHAKTLPQHLYLARCDNTELLFVMKDPDSIQFGFGRTGGYSKTNEGDFLFHVDGDDPEGNEHFGLASDQDEDAMIFAYALNRLCVTRDSDGDFGVMHKDYEYIRDQYGIKTVISYGSMERCQYYEVKGDRNMLQMMVSRPSNEDIDIIISALQQKQ